MASIDGVWNVVIRTPMGPQEFVLNLKSDGDSFSGDASGELGSAPIDGGKVDGDTATWSMKLSKPMPMTLKVRVTVSEYEVEGVVDAGMMGVMPLSGARQD